MLENSSNIEIMNEDSKDSYKEWTRHYSKTYNRYYWFHPSTNVRRWEHPRDLESTCNSQDDQQTNKKLRLNNDTELVNNCKVRVAIVVPFRDIHSEQKRSVQMNQFVIKIPDFYSKSNNSEVNFHIFIIEQNPLDNLKFNRGKLLNVGFDFAKRLGYNMVIFHDIDLIPSSDLLQHYTTIPEFDKPVHIARVWDRYNKNKKYFGGIVAFSCPSFEAINGFPNNFWGWGGEDDEMYNRLVKLKFHPISPERGNIEDLENLSLEKKLDVLRSHREWKCMNKNEVLSEHNSTWKNNGLKDLLYREISRRQMNEHATIITVDLGLNSHWTDKLCGINDTSLPDNIKS